MAHQLKYLLFFVVLSLYNNVLASCEDNNQAPDSSTPEAPYVCNDSVEQRLSDGNYVWTAKFMNEAIKKKPNESAIMSPFSVLIPIGELCLYSEDNTYTQLMSTLNLRSKDDIKCVFPRVINKLRAQKNIILNLANRIFSTDTYPLSKKFLSDTKDVFDAEAESADFNKPQAAADRVNEWVASETNNRIQNIAEPDMFDGDTRLVLANAIYFLGNWIRQFNPNNTEDRDFNVNNQKTIKIPTMYQENSFPYGESQDLDCKILKLPYKGGNFSFVIYLPNKVEGLPALLEKLQEPSAFYNSYDAASYAKVQVYLPKIKTESSYDLAEIMKSAGMVDVFGPKSNLDGILKTFEPLYISEAVQKAFGVCDETGTEAAAANIFVVGVTSAIYPPPVTYVFDAKQPFVYYIMYERYPIFAGTFYGDSKP